MKAILDLTGSEKKFHPITKSIPFEMLPFVDRPIIEFFMRELIESGIKNVLIATTQKNKITEDYFDKEIELEPLFISENAQKKLDKIDTLPEDITLVSKRINETNEARHPLYQLGNYIEEELFVYIKPQYLVLNSFTSTKRLVETSIKSKSNGISIFNASQIDKKNIKHLLKVKFENRTPKIVGLLAKPFMDLKDPQFCSMKRYCLHSNVIDAFSNKKFRNYEIEEVLFQTNVNNLNKTSFVPEIFTGDILDLTNTFEYVKSFTKFALAREDYKGDFKSYLTEFFEN
ncbi:MAG: sugar phosphate nucleotidyltransferase [Candidatus Hodarchaeales archaeon]|jgi:UTP--glucose-1-phosphate uridylyltransferase